MLAQIRRLTLPLLLAMALSAHAFGQSYKHFRLGHAQDSRTTPVPGYALMGGGKDLDAAFKWLCQHASGGDFLVLRARGNDDYNSYINGLCKTNSVSTLILPDRAAAEDPDVEAIIKHAEAVFVAGGDQANYLNFWANTTVQKELDAAIARGVPIGGTSAGLAVMGEFVYSAQGDATGDPDLSSAVALANPFHPRVTLQRTFVQIPILKNTLTDTHFRKRDRMGRTLVFLSRIVQDGWSAHPREIAVEERAAVLLDPSGAATVVGSGPVYFLEATEAPGVCVANEALTIHGIAVYRAEPGGRFDVAKWSGSGGVAYRLSVEQGVIHSTQKGASVY
jgi:cyanophycinase